MRKLIYLWALLLFNISLMAQIHSENMWDIYFNEDFNGFDRGWGDDYLDKQQGNPSYQPIWRAYYHEYYPSGITLNLHQHHIFQRSQCIFNDGINYSDGIFRIAAKRIDNTTNTSAECGDYELPKWEGSGHDCDHDHHFLYFYSGAIETIEPFLYGYFEIRCKTPVHRGAFPAFWLWGNGRRYEEIDIFEYMWNITIPQNDHPSPELGYRHVFNKGMYFDVDAQGNRKLFAHKIVRFPETQPDMNQWHTFGMEWLPGRVVWYFDDEVVNEFYESENIPYGPMTLKANYSLDNWSLVHQWDSSAAPIAFEGDTMMIDYIRVYHLNTACDEDVVITNPLQLDTIQTMKHSLSFSPLNGSIIMPTTLNKTLRAETITMNGEMEIPAGTQLTLIAHPCPCWEEESRSNTIAKKNRQTKSPKP